MDMTFVQYPGYTVEIPDHLIHHFKVLATVLQASNFYHPCELLNFPASAELINACDQCVFTAIGKQFAHEIKITDACNQWRHLNSIERVTAITKAARRVDPLDITEMKSKGGRHDFN